MFCHIQESIYRSSKAISWTNFNVFQDDTDHLLYRQEKITRTNWNYIFFQHLRKQLSSYDRC